MKFSKNWLTEILKFDIDTAKLAEQLTMLGLEVAAVKPAAPHFTGVVIGEVIETKPHPNADKLTLCKVDVGSNELLEIVCGASNVRPKLKVATALIDAVLPDNFKIKKAKLRGVESSGMLCSATELGLPQTGPGILELPSDAPVGVDIREYLLLNDEIIEIELTANRGDCLSVYGIAREVSAVNGRQFISPAAPKFELSSDVFPVEIQAEDRCPYYAGRIIRGINNQLVTPVWMQERLKRSDLRPINFIVDVTNYVMLELGQPLHAFDLSKLDKQIVVRRARVGESLELLDGKKVDLDQETLVIADNNKVLALAGIMGGNATGVLGDTQDIFLESAFFAPEKVALARRKFNLQTDSSYRFERGVDYNLQLRALDRATELILELSKNSRPGPIVEVKSSQYFPKPVKIGLNLNKISDILGVTFDTQAIHQVLQFLNISLEQGACGYVATIPSYRFDLKIEEDLAEEVARVCGYHLIPEKPIIAELKDNSNSASKFERKRLYFLMEDLGYREVINYSFVDDKLQQLVSGGRPCLSLVNPISADMSVMRSTLWPGLIKTLQHNLKRQKERARFFEIGLRFLPEGGGLKQELSLAGLVYGDLCQKQWGIKQKNGTDFFDLKNDLNSILQLFAPGMIEYKPCLHSALHPKRSAEIKFGNVSLGVLGEIHPFVRQELEINNEFLLFKINLNNLINKLGVEFKEFSFFPKAERDISIVVDKEITWDQIRQKIVDISQELLQNIYLFDVYYSENIGLDKRSMAIRLVFQSAQRTLVDSEIDSLVNNIIFGLEQTFHANLRG